MSVVEQNSSSGFWSSLFGPHSGNKHGADKTKAYKPVTFRPTDILPSAESPLSKGVTPFPPGSSSVAANGIGLPVAAGDSVPNGSLVWKPSSTVAAERMTSPPTEPWRPPTFGTPLGKPETPVATSLAESSTVADREQTTVSAAFQWTPVKREQSTSQQTPKSPRATSVKAICKQWPPPKVPDKDEKPSAGFFSSAADDVVTMRSEVGSKSDDSVRNRVQDETTSKVANDVTSQSRCSSVMKDIENCLTDEWWDSLFATYINDSSDAATSKPASASQSNRNVITNGFSGPSNVSKADNVYPMTSDSQSTPSVHSTAAVLRLSNALQRAPADNAQGGLSALEQGSPSRSRKIPPPTLPKDRQKMAGNQILQEWKSGLTDDVDNRVGPKTQEYTKRKDEVVRQQPKSPAAAAGGIDQSPSVKGVDSVRIQLKETSDQTKDSSNGPKPVKFEGIGPTDSETGVPIATRTSVDEENRKDWYKCMYKSLHKVEKPPEVNPYLTAYVLTAPNSPTKKDGDVNSLGSPNSAIVLSSTLDGDQFLYPPHARYRPQRYKNQPKRIEDYEPGCSSLAEKQAKTCESERLLENVRCAESDADLDYRSGNESCNTTTSGRHKRNSRKPARQVDSLTFRQQWDQENRKRREEIDRVIEAERQKRFVNEQKAIKAQRHSDFLSPAEKARLLMNRFEDDVTLQTADSLQRPQYKASTRVRGKAKALHTFRAQNNRELSFKKGDTVYLLRQVDKNWFKGERHGAVGIFPINYVEVLTSIEEAQVAAGIREGRAWAKYNFRGQTPKELSMRKGDVVKLVRRLDDEWYEGRINGRQGIVPAIYVELSKEPETPLITPMSSRANTPVFGDSSFISPASSMLSLNGPDLPSRPTSPWTSDFYDSEFEVDREPNRSRRSEYSSNTNSLQRDKKKPARTGSDAKPDDKAGPVAANYLYYRSQNVLGHGPPYAWPSSEQSTLNRGDRATAAADVRREAAPRDLFELARRRRQDEIDPHGLGTTAADRNVDWGSRSRSLPRTKTTVDGDTAVTGNAMAKRPNDFKSLRAKSSSPLTLTSLQSSSYAQKQQPQRRTEISSPTPKFQRYRAVYSYAPRHIDELEVREGDIVEVMEKCDDGWYVGTSVRTNEFGTFPGNYVQPVD